MKPMSKKIKFAFYFSFIFLIVLVIIFACGYVLYARYEAIKESESNYEALSAQMDAIKEDFNKVYSYDNYSIYPTKNGFKVSLTAEGDVSIGNTMIGYFDSDYNFINSKYSEPGIIDSYIVIIVLFIVLGAIYGSFVIFVCRKFLY